MNIAPSHWPAWTVSYEPMPAERPALSWSDERAVLPLQPDGFALVDRARRHTTLAGVAPDDDALLHPYFGSTALAHASWSGRVALHGGVLASPSGAWGLLGEREAGKSSALAWWIREGATVVADDLVVTDGDHVYAGPRFVDLRESAHSHFGLGADVGVLGTRRRWRVPLGPVAAESPCAGLVDLAWGDEISVDVVPMTERISLLRTHMGFRVPVGTPDRTVLQVLGKPMLRFTRPRSWSVVDSAMRQLSDVLESYPAG